MLRQYLAALALLALASCSDTQRYGVDDYAFERAEFERDQVVVTVVQHATRQDFERAARAAKIASADTIAAFAHFGIEAPTCTIHIERLDAKYQPEWLGHEMAHCIHGRFHGERKR